MLSTGCENKRDDSGSLGGMWQLTEWRAADGTIAYQKPDTTLYYKVRQNLLMLQELPGETDSYFLTRYHRTPDSLVIDRPTEANPHNKTVRLETTSQYNCTGTSWVTVTYNVGIDDVDALKVSVYPNPASRYLNLESAEGISNVTVYNALGQQVIARSVNAENVQLDLSSLAIGNYTLRIVSLNGKESTRKFIVNK
jgi:membrane carboxypeptidase/penicillin-binding protein PbpC